MRQTCCIARQSELPILNLSGGVLSVGGGGFNHLITLEFFFFFFLLASRTTGIRGVLCCLWPLKHITGYNGVLNTSSLVNLVSCCNFVASSAFLYATGPLNRCGLVDRREGFTYLPSSHQNLLLAATKDSVIWI